jgi:hypothetical protein
MNDIKTDGQGTLKTTLKEVIKNNTREILDRAADEIAGLFEDASHQAHGGHKKAPTKRIMKMAHAVVVASWLGDKRVFVTTNFYSSYEEASREERMFVDKVIWPLTINGVEQWVEIEVEE